MYLVSIVVALPELLSLGLAHHDGRDRLQVRGVAAHRYLDVLVGAPDEPVDVCAQMVLHVSGTLLNMVNLIKKQVK